MLDPKTIVLSLPIIAGEPLEGVSYFSSYFRIQEGPVNLSFYSSKVAQCFPYISRFLDPFPQFFALFACCSFFFFNSLTLLFYSVKQGCPCLPCLEYWGVPLTDVKSHRALVLSWHV